jgi:hypothetical protein
VIFVHVPPVAVKKTPKRPLKEKPRKRPPGKRTKPALRRRRAPGIDDLVRAGESILMATIPLATQTPIQVDSGPARIPLATQTPVHAESSPARIPLATQTPVQADSSPATIPLARQTPVQADSGPATVPLATQTPVQADSGPSNRLTRRQPSRWSAFAHRAGKWLQAAWRRD